MKEILVAGIIAALAIVTVESLNCTQCNSLSESCNITTVSPCLGNVSSSCISSSVDSTLGSINSYLEKSCFSEECTETEKMIAAFTVRVSDKEHFSFASQCCQGEGCNANRTVSAPSSEGKPGSTICPACHESNETSCTNKSQTCNQEEKCVELVAFFKNDSKTLVLKGCANVSDTTCQFLSNSSRITFGGITFQQFNCRDAATPTSVPTSTQTTTAKTTTPSSATKVSFIPLTLGSLLLLVLTL